MGTNYYLIKKKNYEIKDNDYTELSVHKLNNGWVWNNTYYPNLDELNKEYYVELHIGKSSYGWHFALCIYPEFNINSLEDWLREFKDNKILDEYDKEVTKDEMFETITNRKHRGWEEFKTDKDYEQHIIDSLNEFESNFCCNRVYHNYEEFLYDNHAKRGLNGLLAHDSEYFESTTTGGTYDLTTNWQFS